MMRKLVGYALLAISFLTLVVWAFSQFVQPILPSTINDAGILLFVVLLSVVGFIAGFKDTIELFQLFTKTSNEGQEQENMQGAVIHQSGANISRAENVIIQSIIGQSVSASEPSSVDSPVVRHNLPQPNYGEFIGRENELAQVINILRPYPDSQHSIVTIDGIGGIGKSTLALEVAHRFLHNYEQLPSAERFSAIFWVSAKRTVLTAEGIFPREQALRTLRDIYSTIATVFQLDDAFESYPNQKQSQLVTNALVRQRTLLIVDNLETVDDETVLAFLRELPAPMKAIVTTRHRIDVAYPVRLWGMPWSDIYTLIQLECKKRSVELSEAQARLLYKRTGGVPLAVVWSIGKIGFGHSDESVLEQLGNAEGDITRFCFEESVKSIRGTHSHKLLMALSALDTAISRDALGQITNLSVLDRDEGLAQLEKLSLINKEGSHFSMLPLTKIYAFNELKAHPEFEHESKFELLYKYADLSFAKVAPDVESWWKSSSINGLIAPIGMAGLDRRQYIEFNSSISTHALIGGRTGTGKSNLLHVIITSLSLLYSPIELQMYLVDFKEGVEFKIYTGTKNTQPLVHAHAIAISSEREFSLSVLKNLGEEMTRRGDLFRKAGAESYSSYREQTKAALPRLLLIIDQFEQLLREDDRISYESIVALDRLLKLGRAFGIHVLLSAQNITGIYSLPRSMLSPIGVRVALQMSEADSRLILAEDNPVASMLSRPGQAIYNSRNGLIEGNEIFQVAKLADNEHEDYLKLIGQIVDRTHYTSKSRQVVLEGNVPSRIFTNTILRDSLYKDTWPKSSKTVKFYLGESTDINHPYTISTLRLQARSNILILGQNELTAYSLLSTILLSLYACIRPNNAIFFVVDFSRLDDPWATTLPKIMTVVPHDATLVRPKDFREVLFQVEGIVNQRIKSENSSSERVFFIPFGLNRARELRETDQYGSPGEAAKAMLNICREGPDLGVHVISWCDTYGNLTRILGRRVTSEFDIRIALQMGEDDSNQFIESPKATQLGPNWAYLYDVERVNLEKFKPYQLISEPELEKIREAFKKKRS